ncbi:hypothetical protein FVE85_5601 [Porphyridium purpureum]|uniref:Choice-of-anchor D domain-containing protein n=1 Tax=Porphyridium purpureum TaxID=35688 RepID=A0A5J4Z336_PORPP|nr:hypothetical protein FVE85_5601 [Porphyridium purpureum]|eukprot:POR3445..scf295_1
MDRLALMWSVALALALIGAGQAASIPPVDVDLASKLRTGAVEPVSMDNEVLRLTPYAQVENAGICAVDPNSYNLNKYAAQLAVQDTSLSRCLPFPGSLASLPGTYACGDSLILLVSFDRTLSGTSDPVSADQTGANVAFTLEFDVANSAPGGLIGFQGITTAELSTADAAFTAPTNLQLSVDDLQPAYLTASGDYKKRVSLLVKDVPQAVSVVIRLSVPIVCPVGALVPAGDDFVTLTSFNVSYADATSDTPSISRPYVKYRMEDLLGAGAAFPVVKHRGVVSGGTCADGKEMLGIEAGTVIQHCVSVYNIGTLDLTNMVVEDMGFGDNNQGTLISGFSSTLPAGATESVTYESQFDNVGTFEVPVEARGLNNETNLLFASGSLTVQVNPEVTPPPTPTPGPSFLTAEMNLTSGECSDVLLDPKILITFPGDAHTRCFRVTNTGSWPVALQAVDGGPASFLGQTIQPGAVLEGSITTTVSSAAASGIEVLDFVVAAGDGETFSDAAALLVNPSPGQEALYCYGYRPAGEPSGECFYVRYINDSGNLYEMCDSRGCNPALQCFGYEKLESYYYLLEMRTASRLDENCARVSGTGLFSMSVKL